jgi:hypothetical protein
MSLTFSGKTFKNHRQVPVSIFMVEIAASFIFPKEFVTSTAANLKAEKKFAQNLKGIKNCPLLSKNVNNCTVPVDTVGKKSYKKLLQSIK